MKDIAHCIQLTSFDIPLEEQRDKVYLYQRHGLIQDMKDVHDATMNPFAAEEMEVQRVEFLPVRFKSNNGEETRVYIQRENVEIVSGIIQYIIDKDTHKLRRELDVAEHRILGFIRETQDNERKRIIAEDRYAKLRLYYDKIPRAIKRIFRIPDYIA